MRRLIRRHLRAAWLLIALTLAMKVVVPVGFMPAMVDTASGRALAIVACTGMGAADMTAMPGMAGHEGGDHAPAKPDSPCLGAGIAAPILGAVDPLQLALAFAVAVVVGLLFATPPPRRQTAYLRPHLRGPPSAA